MNLKEARVKMQAVKAKDLATTSTIAKKHGLAVGQSAYGHQLDLNGNYAGERHGIIQGFDKEHVILKHSDTGMNKAYRIEHLSDENTKAYIKK